MGRTNKKPFRRIEDRAVSDLVLGHHHANHWRIESIYVASVPACEKLVIKGEMHVGFLDARTRLVARKSDAFAFASKLVTICEKLEVGNEVQLNSIKGRVESSDGFELRISLNIRGQGAISGFISEGEQSINFQFTSDLMALEQFAKTILKVTSK
jgi:hypothetical protein